MGPPQEVSKNRNLLDLNRQLEGTGPSPLNHRDDCCRSFVPWEFGFLIAR